MFILLEGNGLFVVEQNFSFYWINNELFCSGREKIILLEQQGSFFSGKEDHLLEKQWSFLYWNEKYFIEKIRIFFSSGIKKSFHYNNKGLLVAEKFYWSTKDLFCVGTKRLFYWDNKDILCSGKKIILLEQEGFFSGGSTGSVVEEKDNFIMLR